MFYPLIKLHYKPIQFLLKCQVKIVWCSALGVLLVRKRWCHQRFPVVEHFQKGVEPKKVVLHLTTKQIQKIAWQLTKQQFVFDRLLYFAVVLQKHNAENLTLFISNLFSVRCKRVKDTQQILTEFVLSPLFDL